MSKLQEVLGQLAEHTYVRECQLGNKVLRMETGKVAKQAGGSVVVTLGETVVLVTACANPVAREGVDFFPLTVDYEERMYAAGKIPGGWIKRESRPPERAILISRVIDRPCRPLFPEGFRNDVHVVGLCVSCDGENNPDVLALCGAGAAISLSDIPFEGPVAGVRVGRVNGEFIIDPTEEELKNSDLNLTVAGTRDNLNMVESGCLELPEEVLIQAFEFAHEAIRKIIDMIDELVKVAGKEKGSYAIYAPDAELEKIVRQYLQADFAKAMRIMDKLERQAGFDAITIDLLKEKIAADETISAEERERLLALVDTESAAKDYAAITKHIKEDELMTMIVDEGLRPDGRRVDEIRPLWAEVGVLPRAHGSAIFTRGQTQALSVATLGTLSEAQTFDNIFGENTRRYMHHYNFPPFSVGEARSMRSPGRREVGHGALAERAIVPVLPSEEEFPYAIRVVSDILESNGSSSMASTCGSTLALYDAGVPLKRPVAGIAMGLIKKGDKFVVLTDIQGLEDALGEMDFKVTGTTEGVTALQMDIKMKGVTMDVLARALAQARKARCEIIDLIEEVIPVPRTELSKYAPKVEVITIPVDKIKDVIGPGGKVINKIIAESGAKLEIENDGRVFIAAVNGESATKAKKMVNDIVRDPEVGEIYEGTVQRIMDFGAFVEILPGKEGLLHVSKLKPYHVRSVEDVVKAGDVIKVKLEEIDNLGRLNLSREGLWSDEELAEAESLGNASALDDRPRNSGRERRERKERPAREERP
ncbi:MAG: polyribonucleotide nucleotidyltransferase, partial [bacterium]|nr:polyribonucleotide nucleotidyltransferase [bacterium]